MQMDWGNNKDMTWTVGSNMYSMGDARQESYTVKLVKTTACGPVLTDLYREVHGCST